MPATAQLSAAVREIPVQQRASQLVPESFNNAENTVEVVWTTGARVRRYDYYNDTPYEEELVVTPDAVDMSRFEAGAVQVLDGHNQYSGVRAILGIVVRAKIDKGTGRALLKLSTRDDLAGLVGDIKTGIIRNVSVGYSVQRYVVTPAADRVDGGQLPLYSAARWQPAELSFVPVNADMEAGTRGQAGQLEQRAPGAHPCEFVLADRSIPQQEHKMPDPVQTQVAADIRSLVKRHGLPDTFADNLLNSADMTLDRAGLAILDRRAELDVASGGHLNVIRGTTLVRDPKDGDQLAGDRELMEEALAARMPGGPALKRENPYRHVRFPDMWREMLEVRGVRTTSMSGNQIIERGLHVGGDFSNMLQGAGARVVRAAYGSYMGGVKRIARPTTNRDFRAKQRLALSEAPQLLQVNEHGEFKSGTMAEGKESYGLATYGRIFGITRQALVNDDLDAFGDMSMRLGRGAAEFESKFLCDLLLSNPTLATDSLAVFHATHGNLATGAGSALQESSLSTARAAMRLQKGLDGVTPIDAQPSYLIVPAALETTGQKLLTVIQATKSTDVNPFGGRLELVVEPRLDATSATAWYLSADPMLVDTIEYAFLEGEEGPQVFVQEGFEIDGVQFKVREDFGGAILDFRGLYKSNGV